MGGDFSPEEIREVFEIFSDGECIPPHDVVLAMQALGLGDGSLIDDLPVGGGTVTSSGRSGPDSRVTLEAFEQMVGDKTEGTGDQAVLRQAFNLMAQEAGMGKTDQALTAGGLQAVAGKIGESLDSSTAREFMQAVHTAGLSTNPGELDFHAFASIHRDVSKNSNGAARLPKSTSAHHARDFGSHTAPSHSARSHGSTTSSGGVGRVDESVYDLRTRQPRVAQQAPARTRVEGGKTYYWCSCGHSKNQPFCDGSHTKVNREQGSKFQPVKYTAEEDKYVFFCQCKHTNNPPFCDGSHERL